MLQVQIARLGLIWRFDRQVDVINGEMQANRSNCPSRTPYHINLD